MAPSKTIIPIVERRPPPSLAQSPRLEFLDLGVSPAMSGTIPAQLPTLVNLTMLNLDNSLLSGTIPGTFSQLARLDTLWLGKTRLSGTVPAELGGLPLTGLTLEANSFSGLIPDALCNVYPQLTSCDMSGNSFACPLPAACNASLEQGCGATCGGSHWPSSLPPVAVS